MSKPLIEIVGVFLIASLLLFGYLRYMESRKEFLRFADEYAAYIEKSDSAIAVADSLDIVIQVALARADSIQGRNLILEANLMDLGRRLAIVRQANNRMRSLLTDSTEMYRLAPGTDSIIAIQNEMISNQSTQLVQMGKIVQQKDVAIHSLTVSRDTLLNTIRQLPDAPSVPFLRIDRKTYFFAGAALGTVGVLLLTK